MARFLHPLLLLLAAATDKELARYIQFLKEENKLLRARLPKRIVTTPQERQRLIKFGKPLGAAIKDLITIVSPATFLRWINTQTKTKAKTPRKSGRPRTADEIRDLVLRIARETGWGYTRILGELKKLGINKISRQTVKNILKAHGLEPGPQRGEGTWDEFVKMHAQTLWACDFLSKKVWTTRGLIDMYVLIFLQVGSRRVWISPATAQPDSAWVAQQARNICLRFEDEPEKPTCLMHDADTKFTAQFDAILKSEEIDVKEHLPCSPNLNAHVERFIQSIQQECLDHFVVFGERHLEHLIREYLHYYHQWRPHQGMGNVVLADLSPVPVATGEVRCHEQLGGLLKHYHRATG